MSWNIGSAYRYFTAICQCRYTCISITISLSSRCAEVADWPTSRQRFSRPSITRANDGNSWRGSARPGPTRADLATELNPRSLGQRSAPAGFDPGSLISCQRAGGPRRSLWLSRPVHRALRAHIPPPQAVTARHRPSGAVTGRHRSSGVGTSQTTCDCYRSPATATGHRPSWTVM